MEKKPEIKVLIVDDSAVFRTLLTQGLSAEPELRVVGAAKDPYEARDMIIRFLPDVMVCDIVMPRMDGIEFLRQLMPQHPLPVIVVSAMDGREYGALGAGAVEFVAKPSGGPAGVQPFLSQLAERIRRAAKSGMIRSPAVSAVADKEPAGKGDKSRGERVIAIAASMGGTEAILYLLQSLPPGLPGIVVVQHIPPVFSRMFAARLNALTPFKVSEAETGDRVESGKVLIAPGDRHMRLRRAEEGYKVECRGGDKVSGHCPSADVLFESVANEAGDRGIGIILTGMGFDGAKGLMALRRKGGITLGQDQSSSVIYGMPKAAYELGAVMHQVPIGELGAKLGSLLL